MGHHISWWVNPKGGLWSGSLVGLGCSARESLEEAAWWALGSAFQTSTEPRSPTPPFQHPSKSPFSWDPSLSKGAWLSACLSLGPIEWHVRPEGLSLGCR